METKVSRKEMEKEQRREAILEAAAELFSNRGFHEVKVDDIADHVGLSKGTIYLYFKNKDDLFFSVIADRTQKIYEYLQAALVEEESFLTCIRLFVMQYITFFTEYAPFFKMLQSEKTHMNMEEHYKFHNYAQQAYKVLYEMVFKLIQKGIRDNQIKQRNPHSYAKGLLGILHSVTFHRIIMGSEAELHEEVEDVLDLFLHGAMG